MEVHPPEHPIHTWRDFFIHIATIVVGLLIAIGLEQSVEWMHHRRLVHTAHRNLQSEARANLEKYQVNEQGLVATETELQAELRLLRSVRARPSSAGDLKVTILWFWNPFQTSAYDTARDTGALTYMPFDEVQEIDSAYRQQGYVGQGVDDYVRSIYRIRQPLQGDHKLSDLRPDEVDTMIQSCAAALQDIQLLRVLMQGLGESYRELASA